MIHPSHLRPGRKPDERLFFGLGVVDRLAGMAACAVGLIRGRPNGGVILAGS
jgi:hypothetical protein